MFYCIMKAVEDIETQKKGVVGVLYTVGQSIKQGHETNATWKGPKLWKAMPFRLEALHCCYDRMMWLPILSIIRVSANLFTRLRVRCHYGESPRMYRMIYFFLLFFSHVYLRITP